MLKGATRDGQTATPEGRLRGEGIAGVIVRKTRNIVTGNGLTTELFRDDWALDGKGVAHIIHVQLRAGAISAWHMHERQTDRIFVCDGAIRLVLYDAREGSPTQGRVEAFHLARHDPTVVCVPPGVWHGLKNLEAGPSSFVNFFDRAYEYASPDEWRLPAHTDAIPYRF